MGDHPNSCVTTLTTPPFSPPPKTTSTTACFKMESAPIRLKLATQQHRCCYVDPTPMKLGALHYVNLEQTIRDDDN